MIEIYTYDHIGGPRIYIFIGSNDNDYPDTCPSCMERIKGKKFGMVNMVDSRYTLIINKLKQAGLLDEDYEPVCCYCFNLLEGGLK